MSRMEESMRKIIKKLWSTVLDLLFPPEVCCLCCGHALGDVQEDGLCPACTMALSELEVQQQAYVPREALPPGIIGAWAAYPYTAHARTLILRLKSEHVRAASVPLGKAMALLPGGEADLLVPVPTTRRRLRERGFNQAALLCRVIAKETGMPMREALSRRDDSVSQTFLSGQLRRTNLQGVMEADACVCGQRILLVDDVYTTGSTACEAARALLAAGAVSVAVFTAARALDVEEKRAAAKLPFDQ